MATLSKNKDSVEGSVCFQFQEDHMKPVLANNFMYRKIVLSPAILQSKFPAGKTCYLGEFAVVWELVDKYILEAR